MQYSQFRTEWSQTPVKACERKDQLEQRIDKNGKDKTVASFQKLPRFQLQ